MSSMLQTSTPEPLPVRVHRIYEQLATAHSLEPSERIDVLFQELVRISLSRDHADPGHLLAHPLISGIQEHLWRLCSRGEFLLEKHWSQRIIAAADPWAELQRFPYHNNYEKLTRLELGGLRGISDELPKNVLFVGCGPLPLTSIVLARGHGMRVSNIDIDNDACLTARRLAERLDLAHKLHIEHAGIQELTDLRAYDVVFLAALVGMSRREKEQLLGHLGTIMRPGALLLVRSSQALRALLYPRVEMQDLGVFEPLLELHPHDEVINSVIIARTPGQHTSA